MLQRKNKQWLRKNLSWRFSELGVEFARKGYQAKFTWRIFSKLIETDENFLLKQSRGQYHLIPKRAFQSEDRMDAFVDLFHQKVKPPKKRRW